MLEDAAKFQELQAKKEEEARQFEETIAEAAPLYFDKFASPPSTYENLTSYIPKPIRVQWSHVKIFANWWRRTI